MDVHERSTTMHILDENGKKVKAFTVRGGKAKAVEALRQIEAPFAVCFEASCGYGWLYGKLRKIAARVVVANPKQIRWIFRSRRKNDRIDAEKLAKLLYLGEVPTVHVPDVEVQDWRGMIAFRRRMVAKRSAAKTALRALLRDCGIESPKRLWTRKGMAWLDTIEFDRPLAAIRRDELLDDVRRGDAKIKRLEKELNRIAEASPAVQMLLDIPGIGLRTAEAFVAHVDDPHRFRRTKCIGAYFGLVPCEDSSAGVHRRGHITKECPAGVRHLLVEAAWQVVRRCPEMRAYFERVQRGDKDRRKIALVATAHRLARAMLAMLQTGEAWRYGSEAA
jgi:transposase